MPCVLYVLSIHNDNYYICYATVKLLHKQKNVGTNFVAIGSRSIKFHNFAHI